jgi:hypothetical protein
MMSWLLIGSVLSRTGAGEGLAFVSKGALFSKTLVKPCGEFRRVPPKHSSRTDIQRRNEGHDIAECGSPEVL